MRTTICAAFLALVSNTAQAEVNYMESGFGITFNGCDWGTLVNLDNGYFFECNEYKYSYHYGRMTILEVNGDVKLCEGDFDDAIEEYANDDCYRGTLYRK